MLLKTKAVILLIFICGGACFALEPEEILVVANGDIDASVRIARYYCRKRAVPAENIVTLPLGTSAETTISRDDYDNKLAGPLRATLTGKKFGGKIKCLLTTYGVPIVVDGRGKLQGREEDIKRLRELIEQGKSRIRRLEQDNIADLKRIATEKKRIENNIARLQLNIDLIEGKETNASVDSELSMVLFGNYELYRWQANRLRSNLDISQNLNSPFAVDMGTLMVCRLDGPGEDIIGGLVDKAISAEQTGLKGTAYFDSRGLYKEDQYGLYDQSLRDAAILTELRTKIPVKQEPTAKLFAPGSCPRTAIYCGWYSVRKYVDAFDFVDGAIGYHIASFEAVNLRDPNSSRWCPAMLADGIAATLGAVAEPYLHSFPKPKEFFEELYGGKCLVEAYYQTKPFNSWRLVLIGDPLYRPFKDTGQSGE
ncbi:MAG: TIGR03790 family protein [Sedimentisphaerales bacterium]|nr:TIGR03790 family protein [Sedimentisphaerales bacterium]